MGMRTLSVMTSKLAAMRYAKMSMSAKAKQQSIVNQ